MDNCSIYLVDIKRGKLRGFVHLNSDDYPFCMAFVVHKSMLYMFGDIMLTNDEINMVGHPYAYVLDLFELANTSTTGTGHHDEDELKKPLPTELTQMNAGKRSAVALVVGQMICVFEEILGYKPRDCSFEVFDPKQKT